MPYVDAAETLKGKSVGVIISKTCLISPSCLNYSDIVSLDNSIQKYSGSFVKAGDDVKRENTKYQNSYGFYRFDSTFRVFVDPPPAIRDRLPLITIVSNLDSYQLPEQMRVQEYKVNKDAKATQSTLSTSKDRYVDATCTNAVITAKNWQKILPDTINYLRNKCDPNSTNIKTIETKFKDLARHDIAETYKFKFDAWQKEILEKCTKARNACTDLQQPTRGGTR